MAEDQVKFNPIKLHKLHYYYPLKILFIRLNWSFNLHIMWAGKRNQNAWRVLY